MPTERRTLGVEADAEPRRATRLWNLAPIKARASVEAVRAARCDIGVVCLLRQLGRGGGAGNSGSDVLPVIARVAVRTIGTGVVL